MDRIMAKQHFPEIVGICATLHLNWQRGRIALLAMVGGAVLIVGTLLPWISLFAGLQAYAGITGLHGRLLCGGGALSTIGGVWFLLRGDLTLRWGLGILGFALLTFASWLLLALHQTLVQLASDPLLLAGFGPGLIIVVVGALLIFATLLLSYDSRF
jgi:hypothetical protein